MTLSEARMAALRALPVVHRPRVQSIVGEYRYLRITEIGHSYDGLGGEVPFVVLLQPRETSDSVVRARLDEVFLLSGAELTGDKQGA